MKLCIALLYAVIVIARRCAAIHSVGTRCHTGGKYADTRIHTGIKVHLAQRAGLMVTTRARPRTVVFRRAVTLAHVNWVLRIAIA